MIELPKLTRVDSGHVSIDDITFPTQEIININININEWISIILGAIAHMSMIRIFTYEYDTNGKYGSNYGLKYLNQTI